MLYRRFDWHEHLKRIEGEFQAARFAVQDFRKRLEREPALLAESNLSRIHLRNAEQNLEGT